MERVLTENLKEQDTAGFVSSIRNHQPDNAAFSEPFDYSVYIPKPRDPDAPDQLADEEKECAGSKYLANQDMDLLEGSIISYEIAGMARESGEFVSDEELERLANNVGESYVYLFNKYPVATVGRGSYKNPSNFILSDVRDVRTPA